MNPTRPETANVLRPLTGRYHDACANSLRQCASAENARNAYSIDALLQKPRCGSSGSSRRSQKNVGVMSEILMLVMERSSPGISASATSVQTSLSLFGSTTHCEIRYS